MTPSQLEHLALARFAFERLGMTRDKTAARVLWGVIWKHLKGAKAQLSDINGSEKKEAVTDRTDAAA